MKTPHQVLMVLVFSGLCGAGVHAADALPNEKLWRDAVEHLSQDSNPKIAANKRVVMEAEYAMAASLHTGKGFEAMVQKYFSPDYVQNDPNVPPGRDGFLKWFKAGAMGPEIKPGEKQPGPPAPPPSMIFAENDLVGLIFEAQMPDLANPSKTYTYKPLAVFRVTDGKLAEHWGGMPKGAPYCRFGLCGQP